MEIEVKEEYPAFASGSLRGLEEELDESLEANVMEKAQETPKTAGPAQVIMAGARVDEISFIQSFCRECLMCQPPVQATTTERRMPHQPQAAWALKTAMRDARRCWPRI